MTPSAGTDPIPTALVVLATGAEEMEVAIVVDVLRRAGVQVTLAGLDGSDAVRCSRGLVVVPDCALADDLGVFDVLVLPGGAEGARRLATSPALGTRLREQVAAERWVAAICAAPTALFAHGVAKGRKVTAHPSVMSALAPHYTTLESPVVVDGNLVTSRGPGTSFAFALAIVAALMGPDRAREVATPMVLPE